jgi:hypothetical protein
MPQSDLSFSGWQMVAHGAREASGINDILKLRSLVLVRLVSSFFGYFFLSVRWS